jgi:chitin synthase
VFKVYGDFDKKPTAPVTNNFDQQRGGASAASLAKEKDDMFFVYVIISALLISLSYWQNFTEVRFSTNRLTIFLQKQINELRKHNSKIYMIVSPIKVLLIFFFAYALVPEQVQSQFSQFDKKLNFTTGGKRADTGLFKMSLSSSGYMTTAPVFSGPQTRLASKQRHDLFYDNNDFIIPFVIHVISSIICYYTARVSCKVLMQGIGFALPLALSTPVTFIVLFVSSVRMQYEKIEMFTGPLSAFFYLDSFNSKNSR